jgi:BMFP domain-containing protein YqiC
MANVTSIARDHLDEIIQRGRRQAGRVVERIQTEIPDDRIVQTRAMEAQVHQDGRLALGLEGRQIGDGFLVNPYTVHQNALGQLAERIRVPIRYLRDLMVPDVLEPDPDRPASEGIDQGYRVAQDQSWRRELAQQTLREHLAHADARYLVRSVQQDVRAVLSDHFRRLDARPLFDAFAAACREVGAIPVDGTSSDVRVSVRAIIPRIHEPVPGEPLVLGLDWSTSDFGKAPYAIRFYAERLVCKNGMIGQSEIHKRHLGSRLDDRIEWSAQTLQADTTTMELATGDVVRGALGPARVDAYLASLRASAERETTFAQALRTVGKDLTKAEREQAELAFNGPDVVNLPKGKTQWRAANALSWIANTDGVEEERRLELQELAGKLLPRAA